MNGNVKCFIKVFVVVILVVAILLPINLLYVNGITYLGAQSGMDKFDNVPQNIEFANFGPSYGGSFTYNDLIDQGKSCFNFSLSMQDLYHDYCLYKAYSDHFAPGAVVAITVSYFSFCSNNDTASTPRYYKLLSKEDIKGYTVENDFSANYLPVYGKGSALVRDLLNDTLNSIMTGSVNEEKQETDSESSKTAELKTDSDVRIMTITNGNLKVFGNYIRENEDILVQWIEEMKAAGLKPVLVQTPYWHDYADGFDAELLDKSYAQPLSRVMEKTGIQLLDFTDEANADYRETTEYFNNCDHLSEAGCVEFMKRYLAAITKLGIIA